MMKLHKQVYLIGFLVLSGYLGMAQPTINNINGTICVGDNAGFQVAGSSCTITQWIIGGGGVISGANNQPRVNVVWNSPVNGTYVQVMYSNCTSSWLGSINVNAKSVPSISIAVSGASTVCRSNGNITLTSQGTNVAGTPNYKWYIDSQSTPFATTTTPTYTFAASLLSEGSHSATVSISNLSCATLTSVSSPTSAAFSVTAPLEYTAVMAPIPGSCDLSGTSGSAKVNISIDPWDPNLRFEWYINGGLRQDNDPNRVRPDAFIPTGPRIQMNDQVYCKVYYTGSCVISPVTSNVVTATLISPTTPYAHIGLLGTDTYCSGQTITFTAMSQPSGNSYIWSHRGNSLSTSSSTFQVVAATTANEVNKYTQGDVISVTVNGIAGDCITSHSASASSSMIAVKIGMKPVISRSGPDTYCDNALSTTLTASATGGTPPSGYRWYRDGIIINTETSNIITPTISGAYSVEAQYTGCNQFSDPTTITVIPVEKYTVSISGPDNINGLNVSAQYTAQVVTKTGTGGVLKYAWFIRGEQVLAPSESNSAPTLVVNYGDKVICKLYSDNLCEVSPALSNTISIKYPPNNFSWVKETTVLVKDAKTLAEVDGLQISEGQKSIGWSYFDGLGRQLQSIGVQSSPSKQDMVQPISYNAVGKESFKYLPYTGGTDGTFKSDFKPQDHISYATSSSPQYFFYQNTFAVTPDEKPYAETKFESTPLNRVLKQGAPGIWQPNSIANSLEDKTMKQRYEINISTDVYLFNFDPATNAISVSSEVSEQHYAANALFAQQSYDDKNHMVISFVDKNGRTVCKKVQSNEDNAHREFVSTYYIYDDLGNLLVVLPPEGVDKLKPILNLN